MLSTLKMLLCLLPAFLVVDLLWLAVLMKDFYSHELGDLARRSGSAISPRWGAATLVYLIIPLGLVLFVRPHTQSTSAPGMAFLWGFVFGAILYGVYDLTNLAILEKWTLRMTVADIIWGGVLCGSMSVLMHWIDGMRIVAPLDLNR